MGSRRSSTDPSDGARLVVGEGGDLGRRSCLDEGTGVLSGSVSKLLMRVPRRCKRKVAWFVGVRGTEIGYTLPKVYRGSQSVGGGSYKSLEVCSCALFCLGPRLVTRDLYELSRV